MVGAGEEQSIGLNELEQLLRKQVVKAWTDSSMHALERIGPGFASSGTEVPRDCSNLYPDCRHNGKDPAPGLAARD